MVWVLLALTRMSRKVIQVRLDNVADVMKHIGHCLLKCGSNIVEAEMEILIREHTPRTNKGCLFLIDRCDVDLVITRKTIHKGKDLTPGTFINDLINEGSRIVVFRTGTIEISIIHTNVDRNLFFSH